MILDVRRHRISYRQDKTVMSLQLINYCPLKDLHEVGCVTKNISTPLMTQMKDNFHKTVTYCTRTGATGCGS